MDATCNHTNQNVTVVSRSCTKIFHVNQPSTNPIIFFAFQVGNFDLVPFVNVPGLPVYGLNEDPLPGYGLDEDPLPGYGIDEEPLPGYQG